MTQLEKFRAQFYAEGRASIAELTTGAKSLYRGGGVIMVLAWDRRGLQCYENRSILQGRF